jgi:MFS family permease
MRSYRELFGVAGVPRLVLAAGLSRLTTSMLALALAFAVSEQRGSLADAGLVLTAHAVAIAAGAPVAGRLADRLGPRRVLAAYLVVHTLGYAALLAALTARADTLAIGLAAVLVGGSLPPSAAVLRGHWPVVVAAGRLRTAYAFDSALNSATFVAGPLVAGILVAAVSPVVAILLAATTKVVGDALLATTSSLGRAAPSGESRRLGPLADRRVRLVLVIVALDTFGYGCLDIGAVAHGNGSGVIAGLLLGALSAGEVLGGLGYGARPAPGQLRRQLVVLHLVSAVLLASTGLVAAVPLLVLGYLAAGLAGGARDTVNQLLLTGTAPPAYRTEAFAWLGTFMWAGFGLGTATAGQLQDRAGSTAVYVAAAGAALLAAALAAVASLWTTADARA